MKTDIDREAAGLRIADSMSLIKLIFGNQDRGARLELDANQLSAIFDIINDAERFIRAELSA